MKVPDSEAVDTPQIWLGLFMVTLATLMYEILLTRIFSVTMWYHFAFVAISVAMFGMTVGAIIVYLIPNYFSLERAPYHLALSSLLFAISIVVSFMTHLSTPFIVSRSLVGLYSIAWNYAVISVPFIFSGICVCLALTKFPQQVSKLYAADLAGAAVGCILLIYTMDITDGPTAVIVVAFLASLGTIFFAGSTGAWKLRRFAILCGLSFAAFAVLNTVLAAHQRSLLPLMWVRGALESPLLYEKWNSFSRISVFDGSKEPVGWGLSSTYPSDRKVRQLNLRLDANAGTVLTAFNSMQDLEHLKYDVTNLAYYLKKDSRVLVIGVGGGRDILSALIFGQQSVLGVEINNNILDAINREFGDFTQHLDRNPKVTFVNDEARSYIARQQDKFDIIQVSLIDTYAATAAGAFVLSENSLYTVEAWKIFLEHLRPNGIVTFSRWYRRENPGEVYRLTTLASTSLMQLGIENPRNHIVMVRNMPPPSPYFDWGVGTILVQNAPFSDEALNSIEAVSRRMQFDVVLSPRFALDSTFATLAEGKDLDTFTAQFPLNIAPPTDDNPFFFQMLRLRDIFKKELRERGDINSNLKAVFVLGSLLIVIGGLTFLCIIGPLIATTDRASLRGTLPLMVFFACIGLGFMFVEISQLQRLIIFLGHPTYGLSVVLFSLLIASGLGSYTTQNVSNPRITVSAMIRLFLLIGALIIFGTLTPYAIKGFQGSTTMVRILVSIGILLPLGFFMGMAFPLGMKMASTKSSSLTPWLWGINGATSVCASVLAVAIAMTASISTSFWTGVACYIVAPIAFLWASSGIGIVATVRQKVKASSYKEAA